MAEKTRKKKATYQQIASEAGVSIATVSRILTGSLKVKEETQEKVFAIMRNHGYNIAEIQADRARQNSGIIVLNIPSFDNPFYSQIVRGAKTAAHRHGLQFLINEEHINETTIPTIMELLEKIHAEGLIITNHVPTSILTKLNDTLPLVQCCEYDSTLPIPYVSIDDIAATRSAMEYLISLGRRNIALINGPIRYKYARQRLQGYLESLEKAGIKEDPDLILQLPDVNYDVASSAIKELMLAHKRPDAFFCVSDAYAAAVIKSCTKMGLRVPQDVMVVGFDNIDIAAMLSPTITTINQPKYQLGFSSCELLIELINNPNPSVRSILMETELIVRESTTL